MITAYAVKDIKDKLREIGNAKTKNWGIDDAIAESQDTIAAQNGLFVVLYRVETKPAAGGAVILESNKNRDGIGSNILAVSTRIPCGEEADGDYNVGNVPGIFLGSPIGDSEDHVIKFPSVPFTETLSLVTNYNNSEANDFVKANRFAIVKGVTEITPRTILDSDAHEKKKLVLDTAAAFKVLFEGEIGNEQTIEQDNSFALTNISVTFS